MDKRFDDYERDYLKRLENKDNPNNDGEPSISSGLGFLGKMAIFIVLGLITGAIMALAG